MPDGPEEKKPVGLVLDAEMRGEPEDLLALAAVWTLSAARPEEAELEAVSLSGSSLTGAAFVDAVGRFYSKVILRDYPERFRRYRGLAVGLDDTREAPQEAPQLQNILAFEDAEGEPLYPHEVRKFTDTADPAALIRNALTAKAGGEAAVVLNAPATNLARVLGLNGGRELIQGKVRLLVAALGDPPSTEPDDHLAADVDSARVLFAEWPTPIVVIGESLGEELQFSAEAVRQGVDWAERHPIVDAFRTGDLPDASTRGLAAALYAVRPEESYFETSASGTITVGDDGRLAFTPSAEGRHRFLSFDPAQRDRLEETYRSLVLDQPAAREMPDFLKRFVEQQEAEEKAKEQEEQQP